MENCYRGSLLENDRDRTNDVFTIDLATLTRIIDYDDDVFELHRRVLVVRVLSNALIFFTPVILQVQVQNHLGKRRPLAVSSRVYQEWLQRGWEEP